MQEQPIIQELRTFNEWRSTVAGHIRGLETLIADTGLVPGSVLLRMGNMAHNIANNQLRLAFVGEFSRGKSELINALFFSDYGGRFLPSSSGQTTMCPVEIQNSNSSNALLRLLPINSRSLDLTIKDLKKSQSIWTRLPLPIEQPTARSAVLEQLTETVCVAIEEARRLGLCPPLNQTRKDRINTVCPSCGLGKVQIPRWRHANISMPHPILAAGLTILDTPGLNAIGAEPELTLAMLMEANAVVFILGADTGVTQSDLEIWESYLAGNPRQNHLIVLNKIDTLWDDLKDDEEIEEEIREQISKTADRLGVSTEQVLAVSAQKALIGRVKNNPLLVERSRIEALELAIAHHLIPAKRKLICQESSGLMERLTSDYQLILDNQSKDLEQTRQSLMALKDQTEIKVPRLLAAHQQAITRFEQDRMRFEQKKREFVKQAEQLLFSLLDPVVVDLTISNAKNEMLSAWTTVGIQERFRLFFMETVERFDKALQGAERLNTLMLSSYTDLENRYGLPHLNALPYAIMPRRAELLEMSEYYETFGKKLEIAVNTQSAVVRKAFLTIAQRIRDFVAETLAQAQIWVDEVIGVMDKQLEMHMQRIQKQLQTLQQIESALGSLDQRIGQVQEEMQQKHQAQAQLNALYLPLKQMLMT